MDRKEQTHGKKKTEERKDYIQRFFTEERVTAAGERFIQNNGYAFDRRSLNEKLSANPKYTHLIHYMHGTHGSLRRESVVA